MIRNIIFFIYVLIVLLIGAYSIKSYKAGNHQLVRKLTFLLAGMSFGNTLFMFFTS